MLQSIKDNAKGWIAWVIVILISIPFALWGIHEYLSPTAKLAVAEVNGAELSRNDFYSSYRRQMQAMASRMGGNADLSMFEGMIKQNVLDSMINEELMVQTAVSSGMRVGDALLAARIQSINAFHQDGQFSQIAYQDALQRGGLNPIAFEAQMRRGMLTEQLQRGVTDSEMLTPREQAENERLQKQKRLVSYVEIPLSRFAAEDITLSDEEIQTYYDSHAEEFKTAEKVSVEYVEFSENSLQKTAEETVEPEELQALYDQRRAQFTTPPQWHASHILIEEGDDPAATQKKIADIRRQLDMGVDFATLATAYSADPGSAKKGGDLGRFGPDAMVKPFEDALRAMKAGDISDVVKSGFGYHIIKLHEMIPERVQTFEEVSDKLKAEILGERAAKVFYDGVENFANLAYENPDNLDVLTETLGLKKKSSDFFGRQGGEGVLSHHKVIEAAFSDTVLKHQQNSEVLELGERQMLVLRLREYQPAQQQPLADVKQTITAKLTEQKQRESAENLGKTLLEALKSQPDRLAVATANELSWSEPRWVERRDSSVQPALLKELFRLGRPESGQVFYHGLFPGNGNYIVAALLGVKDGKAAGETETATQQTATLGNSYFDMLVKALRDEADIKKYPEALE